MAPQQRRDLGLKVIAVLIWLAVPSCVLIWGETSRMQKVEFKNRVNSAGAKAMALCKEWSETYSSFISKPGLFQYDRIDADGKAMPSRDVVYLPDPKEVWENHPSAKCVALWAPIQGIEEVVVEGRLVPAKYRSASWNCHRGYRRNPYYSPKVWGSVEYINCLDKEDIWSYGSLWKTHTVWKFDLEGNRLP